MNKTINKDSLLLSWAILWRFTIFSIVFTAPIGYLADKPGHESMHVIFTIIIFLLTLLAMFIVIKGIILRGYGQYTIKVVLKERK